MKTLFLFVFFSTFIWQIVDTPGVIQGDGFKGEYLNLFVFFCVSIRVYIELIMLPWCRYLFIGEASYLY